MSLLLWDGASLIVENIEQPCLVWFVFFAAVRRPLSSVEFLFSDLEYFAQHLLGLLTLPH